MCNLRKVLLIARLYEYNFAHIFNHVHGIRPDIWSTNNPCFVIRGKIQKKNLFMCCVIVCVFISLIITQLIGPTAPGEYATEMMISAGKVGLVIGKFSTVCLFVCFLVFIPNIF